VLVLIFGIVFRTDPVLVKEVRESFGRGTITDAGHRGQVISFMATKAIGTLYRITYQSARNTYATSWEGLRLRLRGSNALEDQFAKAMANIRSEYAIPAISGTGDIYTYDQAILLASGNSWNPRPTLQSYTAYLPALATINEQHLRGPHAPDWILYDLWALDERLPSIEDGLSWPALLDNYTVSSFDGQFVFMRKNQVIRATSNLSVIYQQNQLVGSTVVLPEASAPLFAEVDLKPTLVGRLLLALYKPPQLSMALKLKDGETRTYRVISNMMVTGFFVSPFVYSTEDFESLAVGDRRFLEDRKVVSISIVPSFGGTVFWSPNYLLTLETYSR
jgi:hypothetical protein